MSFKGRKNFKKIMSVRAHIVKKFEYGEPFFNLWHDEYFVSLLDRQGLLDQLNNEGCGLLEIGEENLKKMEEEIEEDTKEGNVSKEEIERAKEIIEEIKKEMKKQGKDYINFFCF